MKPSSILSVELHYRSIIHGGFLIVRQDELRKPSLAEMCSPRAKGVEFLVVFDTIVRPELLGRTIDNKKRPNDV